MPYLGRSPTQAVRARYYYTASAGDTSVSGSDANGNTLIFSDGEFVDVSLNGVSLVAGTDYVTSTANTIGSITAMLVNDVVEVVVYDVFSVFDGNVNSDFSVGGDLSVAGDLTISDKIIHSGDTNTAIRFSGNDTVGIETAGLNRLAINSSGTTKLEKAQLSTQFDTGSFLRLHPSSTTNSGGFTNIFFGTSTTANYGVAVGGLRAGTDDVPSFQIRMLNDAITGVRVLKITNAGEVTMPLQPAFQAHPAQTQPNIGTGAVTVVLGTERFDVGANFASNTFTAPITGKYQLNAIFNVLQMDQDTGYYDMAIVTSNKSYFHSVDPDIFDQDAPFYYAQISALADMDAGDTAKMTITRQDGAAQLDIAVNTNFSGYLAC